jgi:NADPH2:quinone reductase
MAAADHNLAMQSAQMRAWQSTTPGLSGLQLKLISRPVPGPGDVLVRVEAAALNFSDTLMIEDRYQIRPDRPFVPGQEVSGTVVSAGAGSSFAEGERIASKVVHGGLAQYALVRSDMALRVPDGISAEQAAALPVVYTTALVALTESTAVTPGETVLVLAAAGGVGLAAVEIAWHLGARVIAAAGGQEKCALARQHGAHEAVDYCDKRWVDEVNTLTAGHGVNVVFDSVGGDASKEALRLLAWHARWLIVGFSSGEIPKVPAHRLLLRRASGIGVYWNHDRDGPMLKRIAGRIFQLCEQNVIRPHIGAVFELPDLPRALVALAARQTTGKVIIAVS